MSGLMSPVQAERWIGGKRSHLGRSLLRYAIKRERQIGKRIVVREGSGTGRRYWFSKTTIKRYMPELLEDRYERVAKQVKETLERVESRIDERIDERIEMHPIIRTLEKRSEETIGFVDRISSDLERLVKESRRRSAIG